MALHRTAGLLPGLGFLYWLPSGTLVGCSSVARSLVACVELSLRPTLARLSLGDIHAPLMDLQLMGSSLGCPSGEPVATLALARSPAGSYGLLGTSRCGMTCSPWFSCS